MDRNSIFVMLIQRKNLKGKKNISWPQTKEYGTEKHYTENEGPQSF